MPDFEMHLGELEEAPAWVTFTLMVRDGTGKIDLGVAKITVPKPLTEQALRVAINNAAHNLLSPADKPRQFVEEIVRRMNRGLQEVADLSEHPQGGQGGQDAAPGGGDSPPQGG